MATHNNPQIAQPLFKRGETVYMVRNGLRFPMTFVAYTDDFTEAFLHFKHSPKNAFQKVKTDELQPIEAMPKV